MYDGQILQNSTQIILYNKMSGHDCKHCNHSSSSQGGGQNQFNPARRAHVSIPDEDQTSTEEYFANLEKLKKESPELFWFEIYRGTAQNKLYQKWGLEFMRSLNLQPLLGIVGMVAMMLNCEWMPLRVKPFVSGLFFGLLAFLFFNYNVLVGLDRSRKDSVSEWIVWAPLIFFILTAVRGSGSQSTSQTQKKAKKMFEVRPYLDNPQLKCRICNIPKSFRSFHSPICKICVPKFSRHSLVFGISIGAANQLLATLFFFSVFLHSLYVMIKFSQIQSFGLITQIMMYLLNSYLLFSAFWEFMTFFIFNIWYGVTEFEIQNWKMLQYLMKIPLRQFQNNCNNGILHNLIESIYALIGAKGFQSIESMFSESSRDDETGALNEEITNYNQLQFPSIDTSRKHIVNWDKAFIYLIPQMPNYRRRDEVIAMMKRDEPKMIENFRMLKKFKEEVQKQNPDMNQFQVQQKAMMKMQEHMMKNPNMQMMNSKPDDEQQRVVQLQMLAHMKNQFSSNPSIFQKLEYLETNLRERKISTDQVSKGIRDLQSEVMETKVKEVLRQKEQLKKREQNLNVEQEESYNLLKEQQDPKVEEKIPERSNITQGPQQMFQGPSLQQQRMIQIQMLSNLKSQLGGHQEVQKQVGEILTLLQANDITPAEVNIRMSRLQPLVMQARMQPMNQHQMQSEVRQQQSEQVNPVLEQQRMMQIRMLSQAKNQFSGYPQVTDPIQEIITQLTSRQITVQQVNTRMMKIQPIMMKIQAERGASHQMPSPEQQKATLLQMLPQMKMQFQNNPIIYDELSEIERKVHDNSLSHEQIGQRMMQVQQKIMQARAEQFMKQQQPPPKVQQQVEEVINKEQQKPKQIQIKEEQNENKERQIEIDDDDDQ